MMRQVPLIALRTRWPRRVPPWLDVSEQTQSVTSYVSRTAPDARTFCRSRASRGGSPASTRRGQN